MKNYEIVIGLDHNLDLLKSHLNQATNDFIDLNLNNEMIPCITKPTRITKTSATLIDNVMISRSLQRSYDSFVVLEDISDHLACLVVLKDQQKSIKGPSHIITRNLNETKIKEIISSLQHNNWGEFLRDLDANTGFDHFHKLLTKTIDRIAPEKECRVNRNKTAKDPWVTKGILNSIHRQKRLYLDQLRNSTITNKYKSYRNCLQKTLRKAKIAYFKEKCKEYKQDSRKLWKLIHDLLNKRTNNTNDISGIKVDGIPRYDPTSITQEFCKHFSSIGEKFANKIPKSVQGINSYLSSIPTNNKSLFLNPTDNIEIETLINDLVPKNSSGHDNLSNKLLKKLLPAMLEPLTILFNKSLSEGVFPEVMKKADVIPLYKAKDHQETNNYRPISLLLTISKLLEKVMYKRTYGFLEDSKQIYKSQYGFRTAHSCENAISELVSEIIKGKQDGMYTLAVFLDLSKAFDSLEHDVLLNKLHKYGIRGVLPSELILDTPLASITVNFTDDLSDAMDRLVQHEDVSFNEPRHWLKFRDCMDVITGRISDLVDVVSLEKLSKWELIKMKPCRVELVRLQFTQTVKLPTLQTKQDLLDLGEYFTRSKNKPKKIRKSKRPRSVNTNIDYEEDASSGDWTRNKKPKKSKLVPPADGPTAARVRAQTTKTRIPSTRLPALEIDTTVDQITKPVQEQPQPVENDQKDISTSKTKGSFTTRSFVLKKKKRHRKYGCKMCKEVVDSAHLLTIHHRTKHGILYCETCNRAFNNPTSLVRHSYQHNPLRFHCACGVSFAFSSQLLTHSVVHRRHASHHCVYPKCSRSFKNKGI